MLTLLSDFGYQDVYVGVMKGVIATINPQLKVVDLTHKISPQNIAAGRFALMNAYPYFPTGTVHVAVVDPGVGSQRRGVAIQIEEGFLVGPDNGLFSGILAKSPGIAAVELTNSQYWRVPFPSHTFHGRDIFAPVGAHLAKGAALKELGKEVDINSLVQLPLQSYKSMPGKIIGYIQYIDHFGNLITNIPSTEVKDKSWLIVIGNQRIPLTQTYSDRPVGKLVSLIGSHGWLEVAVNGGSAKEVLGLNWGDNIKLMSNNDYLLP